MFDPANEFLPPPVSPTISSPSSSDLDTESTGSFFHDRSTTLGTLMGVSAFPPIIFTTPSLRRDTARVPSGNARKSKKRATKVTGEHLLRRRRKWWWRLCSDQELKPSKLGEFLEVERRFGDGAIFQLDGVGIDLENYNHSTTNNERVLFADGRVLPPAMLVDDDRTSTATGGGSLCRFSVSLPGICC